MSHFGMSWEEATNKVSYQNIVMLSASVPKWDKKSDDESKAPEKSNDLFDILAGELDKGPVKP